MYLLRSKTCCKCLLSIFSICHEGPHKVKFRICYNVHQQSLVCYCCAWHHWILSVCSWETDVNIVRSQICWKCLSLVFSVCHQSAPCSQILNVVNVHQQPLELYMTLLNLPTSSWRIMSRDMARTCGCPWCGKHETGLKQIKHATNAKSKSNTNHVSVNP